MSEKIIDIQAKAKAKIEEERAKFQSQPQGVEGESNQLSESSLPVIIFTDTALNEISDEAIQALMAKNDPPCLFVRSKALVKVETDEKARPSIINVNDSQLRGVMARSANFCKLNHKGMPVPASPPMDAVRDILSLGKLPFPPLEGIVQGPVLRRDGTVLVKPGYDPVSRLYYSPPLDLCVPLIPENPTDDEVNQAINIFKDVFHDFPFIGESDRANALGLTITPQIRPLMPGLVPLAE